MDSIRSIKHTISQSIKSHESITHIIEQNAALPALIFSVIEELFLTLRSYRLSLVFMLLTPFSIFGIQHLMLGRHRQFYLYLFTFSFFGFGVAYDWFNVGAYHRQYLADVKSGALTGPDGDLVNHLTRLAAGLIHFVRVLIAGLIDHSKRSSNHYRPINHPALHHQSNDQFNNHDMNAVYGISTLSNHQYTGGSIKYSDRSIHALLNGDQSINQIIDQPINPPSDQSIHQTTRQVHPTFLIDTVTKLPLVDSADQFVNRSNNLSINPTTNLKSPKFVIQSAEMCSPVDQSSKQSTDRANNQTIDMSPAAVLDLMRAEDALSYRRRSIDRSINQPIVESLKQSADHDIDLSANPSVDQSINRSVNQSNEHPDHKSNEPSINQTNKQSNNQSSKQTIDQCGSHVTDDQSVDPVIPPVGQSIKQSVNQSNNQSNKQTSNQSSPSGKKRSKNNRKNRAN